MAELRKPFLLLALLAILVIVLIERSALRATDVAARLPAFITGSRTTSLDQALNIFTPEQKRRLDELRQEKSNEISALEPDLTGFGVKSMQFVDSFLLFTLALMSLALVVPQWLQGRLQGCVTLIFAIVVIIFAIIFALMVLAKLLVMVAMLLSFPFGTLAYLIIFGDFPRGAANAVLALIFTLKIVFAVLMLLAHQDFVKNIWLVIYVLAAFAANLIVSFLYGIVPGFLVSITDAIAAIVVALVGVILGIVMGVFALVSIILALKPP